MYVQRKLFVGRSLGGCNTVSLSPSALLCLQIIPRFAFVRKRDSPVSNCPVSSSFFFNFFNRTLCKMGLRHHIYLLCPSILDTAEGEREKKKGQT